ncbi:hypothetical protein F4777DRAFT_581963 [Nemania sp. FL0916]|nr:hypothetical protein F4777DRAFT_581963 [Nemania sp. FL0916]
MSLAFSSSAQDFQPIAPNLEFGQRYSYEPLDRTPRKLAFEKCDNCRRCKRKCEPDGRGCKRCTQFNLQCPGLTTRKRCRQTQHLPTFTFPDPVTQGGTIDSESLIPDIYHVIRSAQALRSHVTSSKETCADTAYYAGNSFLPANDGYHCQAQYYRRDLKSRGDLENEIDKLDAAFRRGLPETFPNDLQGSGGWVREAEQWGLAVEDLLCTEEQPVHDEEQPVHDEEQHIHDEEQLVHDEERPLYEEEQPLCEEEQLLCEDEQPLCEDQQPLCEDQQPLCEEEQLEYEEIRMSDFRLNFNKQYKRLKRVTETTSVQIDPGARQLRNLKQAWAATITTMRQLSKLGQCPELIDALCFLCASRALAETAENDRQTLKTAFAQDLKEWRRIFPEVKDVSRFMWGIDLDSVPDSELPPQANSTISQLQASVEELIDKANIILGAQNHDKRRKLDELRAHSQAWSKNNVPVPPGSMPFSPPRTAGRNEPPGQQTYLGTAAFPHEGISPIPLSTTVRLVTGIIFSLVFCFMMVIAHSSLTTVLGIPNLWQSPASQIEKTNADSPIALFATFSSPVPTACPSATESDAHYASFPSIGVNSASQSLSRESDATSHNNAPALEQEASRHRPIQSPFSKANAAHSSDHLVDPIDPKMLDNNFPGLGPRWDWKLNAPVYPPQF